MIRIGYRSGVTGSCRISTLLSVWAVFLAAAVGAEAARLKVVTSFLPIYCFTANIAGDLASIENLLPANVDPHDYQFTARDLRKISDADVIVLNGLGVDGWLERAISSADNRKSRVVARLADGIPARQFIFDADEPWAQRGKFQSQSETRLPNPHIWLDPTLVETGVSNICRALQSADPGHARSYSSNTTAYVARLRALDEELRAKADRFSHRDLVTDHNAFPYFARRYHLNVVGVLELVEDVGPAPEYLARLMETIRNKQIRVLFVVPPAPPREATQIAHDLGIATADLYTVETGVLKPDTYEFEMRQNMESLAKYLR